MKEGKMRIKPSCFTWAILMLTLVFTISVAGPTLAQEEVKVQSRIMSQEKMDDALALRTRLKNQLMKETGLSAEELETLDPALSEALELNGGDPEPIRIMIRKSVQIDCVGECLLERLRDQNMKMLQMKEKAEEGDQVAVREQIRTRTRTRDSEPSGDTIRSETQTQTQNGSGSGDGTGSSGARGK